MQISTLKMIDVITCGLLLIGALNWRLISFSGFDMVARVFGSTTMPGQKYLYPVWDGRHI